MVRKVKKSTKLQSKTSATKLKSSPLARFKAFWCGQRPERKISVCIGFVVLVFGLIYGGLVLYQKTILDINHKDLAKLQQQIISELGAPDAQSLKSRCWYANTALGQGERGCGSYMNIVYVSDDIKLSRTILGSILTTTSKKNVNPSDTALLNSWASQEFSYPYNKTASTSCRIGLIISGSIDKITKPPVNGPFYNKLSVYCSLESPLLEYYPKQYDLGFEEY